MKLKYNFIIRDVVGKQVGIVVGDQSDEFNSMVTLNDTGKFIFEILNKDDTTEAELVEMVKTKYSIGEDLSKEAVTTFLSSLRENGLLVE